jgi:hypothetical protein
MNLQSKRLFSNLTFSYMSKLLILFLIVKNFKSIDSTRSFQRSKRFSRFINDYNTIRFQRNIFNFKVLSNQSIGTHVGLIQFNTNNDIDFSSLNLSFVATRNSNSSSMFSFDPKSFEITTKQILNRQYGTKHYFRLFIFHNNFYSLNQMNQTPITYCSIVINVLDENNNPPRFTMNVYQAQVFENNAPETFVVQVEAVDNDYGENAHITYQILNENKELLPFQIKSDTGKIFTKRILNKELKESYVLNVLAKDNGVKRLEASAQVFIRVLAQNDNRPQFEKSQYELTIPENIEFSTKPVILRVKALDSDYNSLQYQSPIIYSLSGSLNEMNTFEIDQFNGTIKLVSKLNYELKNLYKLNVIARNLAQPTSASHVQLIVNIEDINQNPPVFDAPFYEFMLFEYSKIGSTVGKLYAYDRDSLSRNTSQITYSIDSALSHDFKSNQESFPFAIDPQNGTIYTINELSKNIKSGYEFYVLALNGRRNSDMVYLNSTVKVKVKILDQTDNVPQFSRSFYKINISEEVAIGLPLVTLVVDNKDFDTQLEYSIETGNENNMFTLIKQSNKRVFLTLERSNLNYKKTSFYNLFIKVIDQDGLYSICNVQMDVTPNKNYMPRFTKDFYTFEVYENATIDTLVGNIPAITSDNSTSIVYRLITNTDNLSIIGLNEEYSGSNSFSKNHYNVDHKAPDFRLNEFTGDLYIANSLDRELYDTITLYVTVSDREKPYRSDHAIVQIKVIDTNDNQPVFTRQSYEIDLYENMKIGTYLLRVEANDKDLDSNGEVSYFIEKQNLSYSPIIEIESKTGVIRLRSKPTNDTGNLNYTLVAQDNGNPPLSSKKIVILNQKLKEYHAPLFDLAELHFYLIENQPIGSIVGEIQARDPDHGSKANIVYKLLPDDEMEVNELFELKPNGKFNSVNLVTKFFSTIKSKKEFKFTIRAFSSQIFTDCQISVHLKSLNEKIIQVPKSFKIIFNNYRNYFITENTARVPILNSDDTKNLNFSLIDNLGKQFVLLDENTGQIRLKSILNTNNHINVSFKISINEDNLNSKENLVTTCELNVLMLTDNMIHESVTLHMHNIEMSMFLDNLFENFTYSILKSLPSAKFTMSNIHIFNLVDNSDGFNLTLAVSYDFKNDMFMSSRILKQILYSNRLNIEKSIRVSKIFIYEDQSCAIEPCLNYQECLASTKFAEASSEYIYTNRVQFRPIRVKHDFSCSCPFGFTGKNVSLMCDIEINLCYSNPCGQNGVCVSLESSYVCVCDSGYTGRLCEYKLSEMKCCDETSRNHASQCVGTRSNLLVDFTSKNRLCKGKSTCKNLILGGFLCDKCDGQDYNQFCELRARHFANNSFLILPGLQNRLRFKLKLTFATFDSNGYLLYNGRIDNSNSQITKVHDFIALKIESSFLQLRFSLGDQQTNEINIKSLNVSDGKWRTVTIEYENRNFNIFIDNDDLAYIDACEIANNGRQANSSECIRVNYYHALDAKCSNQIENCYRYFDLNGPLVLGKYLLDKQLSFAESYYEGCIRDLYIEEKFINLEEDLILNSGTIPGCLLNDLSSSIPSVPHKAIANLICERQPCFNNGTCIVKEQNSQEFFCVCTTGFRGKYCEHEIKVKSNLLDYQLDCPAKWWGKEPGICGPCQCDESKNFSPDCNMTNGQCYCKPKFYRQVNKITKEERCVPCDCYLEGSTDLQCEELTGQCSCLKGAGITGRRCDQCVSPFAEMTSKSSECRQLSTNECPRVFSINTWWPRSPFNSIANTSCPKGAIGNVFRTCVENTGWLSDFDMSECKSTKLVNLQLFKWSQEFYSNKSQLNTYQAFKLIDDLNKVTLEADLDDEMEEMNTEQFNLSQEHLSTSTNSLYALDLITIKNLTEQIIQFEILNAPSFLYIQDKYFLSNLFSILSRISNKKYELKLRQLTTRTMANLDFKLTDTLILTNTYIKTILRHNHEYTLNDQVELKFNNLHFCLKNLKSPAYSDSILGIKFKLITVQILAEKLSYMALDAPSNYYSSGLIYSKYTYLNYQVVSSLLILNIEQSELLSESNQTTLVVVEFKLTNNYDSIYDRTNNVIKYRRIKSSDYKCARLNEKFKMWSSAGTKLLSYDTKTQTVKCSFNELGTYAVLTPMSNLNRSSPILVDFSITFYVLMPIALTLLLLCVFILNFLIRFRTGLTVIYSNLCMNVFFMQIIFFIGVNNNASQITCKFFSITQHYFHLSSYLWIFIISLHLYLMLTELRDINKLGSPVFYYVIAYVLPTIIVSLTLGLKQDVYSTRHPSDYTIDSSLYCWLNLNNYNDLFYVLLFPIGIISFGFFILIILSYRETKRSTFKQTDINLVSYSLISSLIFFPFMCFMTVFMVMFLNASLNQVLTGNLALTSISFIYESSTLYQYLYIAFSFGFSIIVFMVFILFNKHIKSQLSKARTSFKNEGSNTEKTPNDSFETCKTTKPILTTNTTKVAYKKEHFAIVQQLQQQQLEQLQQFKNKFVDSNNINVQNILNCNQFINKKNFIDYHDFQNNTNSVSTTTTSGTLEEIDNMTQEPSYLKPDCLFMNDYMSNLANTTESTMNESQTGYNVNFNQPREEAKEYDLVDVGKILKSRFQNQTPKNTVYLEQIKNSNQQQQQEPVVKVTNDNFITKNTLLSEFWPNKIAECDTSFLDGSVIYSPAKLPYMRKNNFNTNDVVFKNDLLNSDQNLECYANQDEKHEIGSSNNTGTKYQNVYTSL